MATQAKYAEETDREAMIDSVLCEVNDNTKIDPPESTRHISSVPMLNKGSEQCGSSLLGCQSSSERLQHAPLVVSSDTGAADTVTVQNATADRVRSDRTKLTTLALTNIYMVGTQGETSVQQALSTINANGSPMSIVAWGEASGLDSVGQQRAFEVMCATFVLSYFRESENTAATAMLPDRFCDIAARLGLLAGTAKLNDKPLRLFLTGPAGSGKSTVINAVKGYAARYTANLGVPFTAYTIRLTALTGAAATEIGAETLHAAAHLWKDSKITVAKIDLWRDTRLLIIDEISFIGYKDLGFLDDRLRRLTECSRQAFGSVPIVFSGDFSQLEPVSAVPLYRLVGAPLWNNEVNMFLEMKGTHRFKHDENWGALLSRMRDGGLTDSDMADINARVVEQAEQGIVLNQELQYATHRNCDRNAINAGLFLKHLEKHHSKDPNAGTPNHTLVIKSDVVYAVTGKVPHRNMLARIYETCGDAQCQQIGGSKRCDPFLRLYTGCRLMVTVNEDVGSGIANGTTCRLRRIKLLEGASTERMTIDGYWLNTTMMSDVEWIECEFEGGLFTGTFRLKPTTETYCVKVPNSLVPGRKRLPAGFKITALPLVLNSATTGHKLQGKSVDNLLVSHWNNAQNWAYVVLSRVRTLKGLHLRSVLPNDINWDPPPELLRMLESFRESLLPEEVIRNTITLLPH
jgi:energy-coupling factor transporter ATP-binding protein EcfA2